MKASLVWPQFTDFSGLDTTWIPHGVTQIATEANARGHVVDVLDGRVYGREGVMSILKNSDVDYVGICMLSSLVGFGKDIHDYLKAERPEIKTVLGGIHPTVAPEDFDGWGYDYLITGEGELTFSDLLEGKETEAMIAGKSPDLDELHSIDRSLIKVQEKPMPGLPEPFATIIIGRGCPYNCTFCQPAERILFGKKVRMRSVENVVAEIESLNIASFMIHDDCFTANSKYVEEFCEKLPDGLTWWCQGRADNVVNNLSLIRKMRDAGLRGMILGHESGDDRVLQSLKKGVTVSENIEATRVLKALGIIVWSNIMLGTPMEPPSAVLNTITMVHEMEPDMTAITIFTPHPGSELYGVCRDNDLSLFDGDWTYYNRGDFAAKIKGQDVAFLGWAANMIKEPEMARAKREA